MIITLFSGNFMMGTLEEFQSNADEHKEVFFAACYKINKRCFSKTIGLKNFCTFGANIENSRFGVTGGIRQNG
jgi:hypothetical protein